MKKNIFRSLMVLLLVALIVCSFGSVYAQEAAPAAPAAEPTAEAAPPVEEPPAKLILFKQGKMVIDGNSDLDEIAGCETKMTPETFDIDLLFAQSPEAVARVWYVLGQRSDLGDDAVIHFDTDEAQLEMQLVYNRLTKDLSKLPQESLAGELDFREHFKAALEASVQTMNKSAQEKRDAYYRTIGFKDEADYWEYVKATALTEEEKAEQRAYDMERQRAKMREAGIPDDDPGTP